MSDKPRRAANGPDRRAFLSLMGAGALATPFLARPAHAAAGDDKLLQALIDQTQSGAPGEGFDSASRTIHMPKASLPTLSASTADTTVQAVGQYEGILARGGWPKVTPVERLRLGNRHPSVVGLRQRLAISGDLDASAADTTSDIFDSYVEAAVRRFQARHGISIDGIVRAETFKRLNIPCGVRVAQLKTNVARLKALSGNLGGRYVMVNIPAAQVEAVENGVAVGRYTAVVGRPDRPSPDVNSKITEVNFNPYWTVPVSLVRRDLVPIMQKDPKYLTNEHIHIYDMHGQELQPSQINWQTNEAVNYRFRQDPGDFNSLGTLRIQFPSPDGVYMHDTPEKGLFGEDMRFHSSGCVRVRNVRELAEWLLRDTPNWSHQQIDATIKSGQRIDVKLKQPVPVHWVYVTAWATPDGVVQFRDDIYNKDGLGAVAATVKG